MENCETLAVPDEKENNRLLDSAPRVCFFIQAGFGAAFTYLTGGVFLSGLALLMGAGDLLVSYLSILINICGVLILSLSAFLERFQSRKRLAVSLTVLSRLLTLFLVAIPALFPVRLRLLIFIPVVVAAFTLQAQTTVVLNQWMMEYTDAKKSGRYISLRQTLTQAVNVALSIVAGAFMDFMGGEYLGFVLIFAAAAFISLCEILLLVRTPDAPVRTSTLSKCRLRDIVRLPLKNRRFMNFVLYIFLFYVLLYIADSFTMVYLMKYLALPYRVVTALYMIISLPQVLLLGVWGKISDRKGHDFVLCSSITVFLGETLFMFLSSPQTWQVFIPVGFLFSSIANAGFVISVFNRRYELMPKENRIVYDNFFTAVIGLGFILGPIIGGAIKEGLESSAVIMENLPLGNIRLLYLIASVGLLTLQIYHYFSNKSSDKGKL